MATVQPGNYSFGVYIGLPVFVVLFFLVLFLLWVVIHALKRVKVMGNSDFERDQAREKRIIIKVIAALLIVVQAVEVFIFVTAWWPFDMSYHRWYKVDGVVTQISSRQISNGKTMSQRYVVVVGGQPYGVDDTRAALLHEGDTVHLMCKKEFVFYSKSGWGCNWNG